MLCVCVREEVHCVFLCYLEIQETLELWQQEQHWLLNISAGFFSEHFRQPNPRAAPVLARPPPCFTTSAGCYIWRADRRAYCRCVAYQRPCNRILAFSMTSPANMTAFFSMACPPRGMLSPVFLVAVWNWRNSARGNLSREEEGGEVCVFHVCGMCFAAVCSCAREYISRHFYTIGRSRGRSLAGEIFLVPLVLQIFYLRLQHSTIKCWITEAADDT